MDRWMDANFKAADLNLKTLILLIKLSSSDTALRIHPGLVAATETSRLSLF